MDANSRAYEMLGYSRDELIGMGISELVPEEVAGSLLDLLNGEAELDEPLETVGYRQGGQEVRVEIEANAVEVEGVRRLLLNMRDVTRKAVKEPPQRIVAEGSSQGIYLFQDGEFKFVNDSFEEISGYSCEELKEMDFLELVHPDYRKQIREWTLRALAGDDSGLPGRIEYKALTKEGREIWVRSLPSLVEYEGRPAIVGNAVDITREKEIEERLSLYKMAVEGSTDLMAACDENYDYLFTNEAYRNFYGTDQETIRGKNLPEVIGNETFRKEVQPRVDRCLQGERVNYEMSRKHPKLGRRMLEIIYYPLSGQEGIRGVVGVLRDITERRQTEERFTAYIDNSPYALFVLDEQGDCVEVNTAAREMTGYTEEELLKMNIWDLVAVESGSGVGEELESLWEKNEVRVELPYQKKDGNRRYWDLYALQLFDDRYLCFVADITSRKQTEKQLEQERERLKQLHRVVEKFQSCQTEEELYEATLEVTETVLGFDISLLYIVREDKLVPVAATKLSPEQLPNYGNDEALAGLTLSKGETLFGDDIREAKAGQPERSDLRSYMSVPLGEIGVFQAASKRKDAFTKVDIELAEILAGHLTEEIQRIRLEEELRQQAIRDPLTDLYNRRYFNETLPKEVEKCKRYDKHLAFLMVDVNRFKEINDRYSHQVGDQVLQNVARLLEENVRSADTVVRYGGDEFLIMMPETNGGVETTTARLEEKLNRWNQNSSLLDFPLTLAIGVSHWSPHQDRDVEEALKEADRKMYEDKNRRL